jgi:hypothetical protein
MVPETGGKVWRYLFPAVLMMGALLVLFAGALGDLRSWTYLQSLLMSVVEEPVDQLPSPKPNPPMSVELPANPPRPATQAAPDDAALQQNRDALQQSRNTLQVQVDSLQKNLAQQTQQLTSLRTSEEQERQTLDALHKQRQDIQTALVQPQSQRQHAPSGTPSGQSTQREPVHRAPQSVSTTGPEATASPWTQLMTARQALMGGRTEDARRMLSLAQTQMVFQPVTPDQPDAAGGNVAATQVGYAIRWLDLGNTGMAMQEINVALSNIPASNANVAPETAAPSPQSPSHASQRPSTANASATWR